MATLEELSHRIEVAGDLQSVVRTMKTISAVAIRQHELAERAMSRYLENVEMGLQVALRDLGDSVAGAKAPAGNGVAVVVVGSEIGLCGGFNDQVASFTMESLRESGDGPDKRRVLTIGARADAAWRADAEPPAAHQEAPATVDALTRTVGAVLTRLDQWRAQHDTVRLDLFHHLPKPQGGTALVRRRLLPIDPARLQELRARPWDSRRLPVSTGAPQALFGQLVRQLVFARVAMAIMQSRTAEHGERLAAMQAADRSIADKIEALRFEYRLLRQNVITSELLDIMSGYEAIMSDSTEPR